MNHEELAAKAALNDTYFTGLMYQIPTFFEQYGQSKLNEKYVRHRSGFELPTHKTNEPKNKKAAATMNDDENESTTISKGTDANAIFGANNQIPSMHNNDDDDDVGFGAPKMYADMAELKRRLELKRSQLEAQPKLTPEQIQSRFEYRKARDEKNKERNNKQVARTQVPIVGKSSSSTAATSDENATQTTKKQKNNKNGKTGDNELVQLSNVQFSSVLQSHDYTAVANAGTKHLHKQTNKHRLQEAEKFQEKVKGLKEAGATEKAEGLIHKKSVSTALARAMGENINDNIRSLKKQVKQGEKAKEVSAKKWKQRENQQKKELNERLDRRNLHIGKKIEHKRESRIARKSKK